MKTSSSAAQGGPHLTLYDDHGYENIGANCLRMIDYGLLII